MKINIKDLKCRILEQVDKDYEAEVDRVKSELIMRRESYTSYPQIADQFRSDSEFTVNSVLASAHQQSHLLKHSQDLYIYQITTTL